MRRKTFDALLSTGGLVMAAVLVAAGALLMWGHSFVDTQVHSQLSQQKIFFPPAGSDALKAPEIAKYVTPYAGQQVVNGQQAQVFADHYIKVHLAEVAGGQTYSQLSTKAMTEPTNTELQGKVQTMFRGETLRGLLLNAYAFWKMGQIALLAGIVSFGGAGLMLLLSGLGFWHLRRVAPEREVLPQLGARTPARVE